jgi:hypothetical protein
MMMTKIFSQAQALTLVRVRGSRGNDDRYLAYFSHTSDSTYALDNPTDRNTRRMFSW